MKTKPNPVIVENLQLAITVIEQTPEKSIDLDRYTFQSPECGTLHCTAGWLAGHPHFQEQGMVLNEVGGMGMHSLSRLKHMFGRFAVHHLFTPACLAGDMDVEVIRRALGRPMNAKEAQKFDQVKESPIPHKTMAVGRLKLQLERILNGDY
jgi:hypothetical protein